MMAILIEGHIEIEDPLRKGGIQIKVEGHLIEEHTLIEDLLGEGIQIEMEDPLEEEDTQEEDPLMEVEDPLMEMEDPLMEMEDPWTSWWTRTTRSSRIPGPVRPIIVQTPQVTLDTSALENTFDSVGQSMLQLARAQDQTNRQLQQHIQQGQLYMQAHTGALQQLATSTYQRNFNHIFASIPLYDRSDREGFFLWLEHLEAACFCSGRNIKTEALGRSTGPVQNVIMALPNARS